MSRDSTLSQGQAISAEQNVHDAVFVLACLEVLDFVIASKTTPALQINDHSAHKDFQHKLLLTKERIPGISAHGGALQVAAQQLGTLTRGLEEIADKIQRIDSECISFRSEQEDQSHKLLFGNGAISRLMAESRRGSTQGPKPDSDALNAWLNSNDITGFKLSGQSVQAWVDDLKSGIESATSAHRQLKKKFTSVITEIKTEFNSFCNAVAPKAQKNSPDTDLLKQHSVSPTEVDVLIFSKPPQLETLKLSASVSLYLNLAEDISTGGIDFQALNTTAVGQSYESFMGCALALRQIPFPSQECTKQLNAIRGKP